MESSRRPPPAEPARVATDPPAAVRDSIGALRSDARLAIAFSGGLDSTVLLHAACQALGVERVLALHIDHGLQPASPGWREHCAGVAASLGVAFLSSRLTARPPRGDSVEAWAREARYQALAALAHETGVSVLATAHHADDQIETFLLRLARGAGLDGLRGIAPQTRRQGLTLLRPLLGLSRRQLEAWAQAQGLRWIDDPSNTDERIARNAVRRRVLPVLDEVLPGLRAHLPATLASLREAGQLLDDAARRELAAIRVDSAGFGACLSWSGWRMLPPERRGSALRLWLADQALRMPSRARLAEMVRQLDSPRDDAQISIRHDGRVVHRYRDLILLGDDPGTSQAPTAACRLSWHGEAQIDCPAFGGAISLRPLHTGSDPGLPASLLRSGTLELRRRQPGDRLRLRADAPHRSLKNLYQEAGIPAWRREALPVLGIGTRAVWVPGLGLDADHATRTGERYRLDWITTD